MSTGQQAPFPTHDSNKVYSSTTDTSDSPPAIRSSHSVEHREHR